MPILLPVLDTHTGGELTRIVDGHEIGLGSATVSEQVERLKSDLDWVRRSLTTEPRGSAFAVGAVLTRPSAEVPDYRIVFFNNVGYLGMCGHGLIGVVEALRYQDRMSPGAIRFETPAGSVQATLASGGDVTTTGVPSYRHSADVSVRLEDGTDVVGDVAYGGNWFFLAADPDVGHASIESLMAKTQMIRRGLEQSAITGAGGAVIDHIELYTPIEGGCRNFVLCPGGHYDRSPCGTGTAAKLSCLAADGDLQPDQIWIQQSVTGSHFQASYQWDGTRVRATISGRAHVIAETTQVYDPDDALRLGFSPTGKPENEAGEPETQETVR